jgi:hypothetical protein
MLMTDTMKKLLDDQAKVRQGAHELLADVCTNIDEICAKLKVITGSEGLHNNWESVQVRIPKDFEDNEEVKTLIGSLEDAMDSANHICDQFGLTYSPGTEGHTYYGDGSGGAGWNRSDSSC